MTAQAKRQISEHAAAAKAIRGYAKSMGVVCRATSDSFSMGSSVDWTVTDLDPVRFNELDALARQHQYGHFNGMEDIYECSNSRRDIPQAKFVSSHREFSPELYQAAYAWLRAQYPANAKPLPESYGAAKEWDWYEGTSAGYPQYHAMVRHQVWQLLTGDSYDETLDWKGFWDQFEPKKEESLAVRVTPGTWPLVSPSEPDPQATSATAMRIETHTHSKKGFEMHICIMVERVERAEFDAMLERARESGGWYTRPWGTTPGGFAFKDLAKAKSFAGATISAPAVKAESVTKTPKKPAGVTAEQLRAQAARLHKNAAACFADRLTNTPKRLGQAMRKRLDGQRDERTARALEAVANMLDAGEPMPYYLNKHRAVEIPGMLRELLSYKTEPARNGYHGYDVETNTPKCDTQAARDAFALLDGTTESARKAETDIKQKVESLRFARIPGYFPTTAPVVASMLELVEQSEPVRILEPSAGSGNIADALRDAFPKSEIDCLEINHDLREVLTAKGHSVAGSDFMALTDGGYNLIAMNPPFENLQDAAHVMHAFGLLAPGGELVAIMSPSVFFRDDKHGHSFRQWFARFGGGAPVALPEGSFKQSGTNVNSVMIYMRK